MTKAMSLTAEFISLKSFEHNRLKISADLGFSKPESSLLGCSTFETTVFKVFGASETRFCGIGARGMEGDVGFIEGKVGAEGKTEGIGDGTVGAEGKTEGFGDGTVGAEGKTEGAEGTGEAGLMKLSGYLFSDFIGTSFNFSHKEYAT